MKSVTTKILLVDDHQLIRRALIRLIGTFRFKSKFYEASNGWEALKILTSTKVDIILLDMQMPEMGGIETLKRVRQLGTKVKIITLTQFDEESLTVRLLQLGADGLLLKACDPDELENAILEVMTHGHYYNIRILKAIEHSLSGRSNLPNLDISPREFQILSMLKDGRSNKDISKSLGLTLRTIESYRKNLIKKTKSKNSLDLIALAYRTGIV